MSLKLFNAEIAKGLPAPCYLIHSEDAALMKEAVTRIKAIVPPEDMDFCYNAFDFETPDGAATPVGRIIDVLNTVSFMGGRTVVIVEGINKLAAEGIKQLGTYVENPAPGSLLVAMYRGKKPKKNVLDNLQAAKQFGIAIRESDLPYWIKAEAESRGIKMTKEAVECLIAAVGVEVGILISEIQKLSGLGKATVDADDVAEMVRSSRSHNVFELTDALERRDTDAVFRVYRALAETEEPYAMLGALNWFYGNRYQSGRGMTQKAPSGPDRASGKSSSPKLAKIYALLQEADFEFRATGGAYPIEHLLVKLLRVG